MCKMLIKLFCLGFGACQNVESTAMKAIHSYIFHIHSLIPQINPGSQLGARDVLGTRKTKQSLSM